MNPEGLLLVMEPERKSLSSWRTLCGANVCPLEPHCQWMPPAPTVLLTVAGAKVKVSLGATVSVVVERPNARAGTASRPTVAPISR